MIKTGNLYGQIKSRPKLNGWFMGRFIKDYFHNDDFELKWCVSKKGEKKSSITANKTAKTLTILIKGKMRVDFPKNKKKIILDKEGDYVYLDTGVFHGRETLKDTTTITIRWPSVKNDVITLE
jgi:hypothetical protein